MLAQQPGAVCQPDDRVNAVQSGYPDEPADLAEAAQIDIVVLIAQGCGTRLSTQTRPQVRNRARIPAGTARAASSHNLLARGPVQLQFQVWIGDICLRDGMLKGLGL